MKEIKIDGVKVLAIAGSVLGAVGTILSTISSKKEMAETIKKEVEKATSSK